MAIYRKVVVDGTCTGHRRRRQIVFLQIRSLEMVPEISYFPVAINLRKRNSAAEQLPRSRFVQHQEKMMIIIMIMRQQEMATEDDQDKLYLSVECIPRLIRVGD